METTKNEVIKLIEDLPENVNIDDIIEELYFKIQVDSGLKELDEGKRISHDEVEKRTAQWIKK
ncbi:MAG: hypothetical protein A2068_08280 [Ignavibacteria bacterium GWB2_35_6b]|nr:MAG: hypothetical protein A2068_08280 [Ignavibacteria bacterium GWB2_35_6b]